MNKFYFLLFMVISILVACGEKPNPEISLNDILLAFEERELVLKETERNPNSVFGMELYKVKPATFLLNDKLLLIFIYHSPDEVEKAIEDFKQKTAGKNIAAYEVFEVKNVLMYYVIIRGHEEFETVQIINEIVNSF